jgi:hypothetical protein
LRYWRLGVRGLCLAVRKTEAGIMLENVAEFTPSNARCVGRLHFSFIRINAKML